MSLTLGLQIGQAIPAGEPSLAVLPECMEGAAPDRMLFASLQKQAEFHLDRRRREVASIQTAAEVTSRQAQLETWFRTTLGKFPPVIERRTLVTAGEGCEVSLFGEEAPPGQFYPLFGTNEKVPGGTPLATPRFHVGPGGRLFIVYYASGQDAAGMAVAENRMLEIRAEGLAYHPLLRLVLEQGPGDAPQGRRSGDSGAGGRRGSHDEPRELVFVAEDEPRELTYVDEDRFWREF